MIWLSGFSFGFCACYLFLNRKTVASKTTNILNKIAQVEQFKARVPGKNQVIFDDEDEAKNWDQVNW